VLFNKKSKVKHDKQAETNLTHIWTKEMIDYMKMEYRYPIVNFPICINSVVSFATYEHEDDGAMDKDERERTNYYGRTRYGDNYDFDDREIHELLAQVYIRVEFYGKKYLDWVAGQERYAKEYEELRSDTFKYGYLEIGNQTKEHIIKVVEDDISRPVGLVSLNNEYGIREKINDLFTKSKVFGHKSLLIDIGYDWRYIKDVENEKLCNGGYKIPINEISIVGRFALD